MNLRKRVKLLKQMIERDLGYTCESIEQTGGSHICCRVKDDKGHRFRAYTGLTPRAERSALLNFKQDIRRLSLRAKGVI